MPQKCRFPFRGIVLYGYPMLEKPHDPQGLEQLIRSSASRTDKLSCVRSPWRPTVADEPQCAPRTALGLTNPNLRRVRGAEPGAYRICSSMSLSSSSSLSKKGLQTVTDGQKVGVVTLLHCAGPGLACSNNPQLNSFQSLNSQRLIYLVTGHTCAGARREHTAHPMPKPGA